MYRKYCHDQEWQMITPKNGKLRKKWIGGDRTKTKIHSYGAFHKFWVISYQRVCALGATFLPTRLGMQPSIIQLVSRYVNQRTQQIRHPCSKKLSQRRS